METYTKKTMRMHKNACGSNKLEYDTEDIAIKAAEISSLWQKKNYTAYFCPVCNKYHVGRTPSKEPIAQILTKTENGTIKPQPIITKETSTKPKEIPMAEKPKELETVYIIIDKSTNLRADSHSYVNYEDAQIMRDTYNKYVELDAYKIVNLEIAPLILGSNLSTNQQRIIRDGLFYNFLVWNKLFKDSQNIISLPIEKPFSKPKPKIEKSIIAVEEKSNMNITYSPIITSLRKHVLSWMEAINHPVTMQEIFRYIIHCQGKENTLKNRKALRYLFSVTKSGTGSSLRKPQIKDKRYLIETKIPLDGQKSKNKTYIIATAVDTAETFVQKPKFKIQKCDDLPLRIQLLNWIEKQPTRPTKEKIYEKLFKIKKIENNPQNRTIHSSYFQPAGKTCGGNSLLMPQKEEKRYLQRCGDKFKVVIEKTC